MHFKDHFIRKSKYCQSRATFWLCSFSTFCTFLGLDFFFKKSKKTPILTFNTFRKKHFFVLRRTQNLTKLKFKRYVRLIELFKC